MNIRVVSCLLVLAMAVFALVGCTEPQMSEEQELWAKEDLEFFRNEIEEVHPDPFYKLPEDDFHAQVEQLKTDLGSLTYDEFQIRLMQIIASMEDAHTNLHYSFEEDSRYPVQFRWFSDGLYVVAAARQYRGVLGGRVVSMNGLPVDEVMHRLDTVISRETEGWLKESVNPEIVSVPILRELEMSRMGL